jgi:dipeptidyl-peptidase-4
VGDPNPVATLGVVDLAGKTTWMKDPYAGQETLIVQVGWDPKGRLMASLQDRVQTWLDLVMYDGDAPKSVIRETSRAWQERLPLPVFLKDGGFLWESDRTGFRHLYRYDAEHRLAGAVTAGAWEVKAFHGVDEKAGRVFFSGTERSPIGQDAYRVDLKGRAPNAGLARLTAEAGTHTVRFNPTFSAFLDTWSSRSVLPRQDLFDGGGKLQRTVDSKVTEAFKALKLGVVKYQQVRTRDGFPMETMLVLPPDFDPARKYPVFQHVYGGPAAPQVRDAFGRDLLWYHFLAQQGYVVWVCDNRSASAKGIASAFGIWRNLGAQELQDQLEGLDWLKAQGWADMDRVALEGWSYGGYFTAFAMTRSKAWKIGLVGAPVTDFRLYDSIYTERYMGLPTENAKGYDAGSVLKAAKDLSGKVLLMHGTSDDNVHPQNTIQLIDALQKAGKPCELQLYPGSDHGPRAPHHVWSRMNAMWDFLKRNL